MSLYAQCPACPRVFRPRSMDPAACWKSVKMHVQTLAHDCQHHKRVKEDVFDRPDRVACPVCQTVFRSATEACIHMSADSDEAHSTFRAHAAGRLANRDRERAPGLPFRQRMLDSALYSAAKSGRSDEVTVQLDGGADPNGGGEDGFTPLMTASEAGHEEVVGILLGRRECEINARNKYGQTALCLAAINGRVEVTITLLRREDLEVESVGGGLTVAEKTRKAGFSGLADMLASAAKEKQLEKILQAVMDQDGVAAGAFDSITQRIEALSSKLAVQRRSDDDDVPQMLGDAGVCSVCMVNPIEMVLMPCFHACLCSACSVALQAGPCPICRSRTQSSRRIYFP